ncbi:MAG: DUF2723 domain-containing protein, partial [Chloroflexi bacterium]|nr:DUF2723 domain-containing protein [Chloroflexota bacterium]
MITLAQSPVLGDPTEYTFIANILGIAHPPGYAFITLAGKLFQTLIPFGEIPWRMHLLSAASATLATLFVYGVIRNLTGSPANVGHETNRSKNLSGLVALFAALTVGTAVNFWQHAIHANPHIVTATFLTANLYFLTKWAVSEQVSRWAEEPGRKNPARPLARPLAHLSTGWLYAFALSAGLGVTHHPLTVFGFPAYAIFIVWVRPSILKEWRTLLKMVGFALLGLSVWLYYPLRSPSVPFGPTGMNTLNGFLDHVLARGLSDSLPYFGWADQWDRIIVFWSILRLQYSLPVILLAAWGLIWPFLRMRSQIKFDKETHPQRLDRYPKSKVKNGQAL